MPCAYCKANHDSDSCPWSARARTYFKSKELKESYTGGTPAPFIGRYGYPDVNVGILTPPGIDESQQYDAPKEWALRGESISSIAELRGTLINSHIKGNVHHLQGKLLETAQITAMSNKPLHVSVELEKKPVYAVHFDHHAAPTGPTGTLKKIEQENNPHVLTHIQKAVSDTDLKSAEALNILYTKGIYENKLTQLLSTGTLGIGKNRKLVPTRWSITATDDTLGKEIRKEVILNQEISECELYTGTYHGNYYYILLYPGTWAYELTEYSLSTNGVSRDSEGFTGRTSYAENCVGGYYTVKFAILEHLLQRKKQAGALVLRVITPEYTMPLGVWVTREASRKTMNTVPQKFNNKEEMKKELLKQLSTKHTMASTHPIIETLFRTSTIHNNKENQRKIWEY